jgi:hypothetical protein
MSHLVLRVDHDDEGAPREFGATPTSGPGSQLVLSRPLGGSTWLARLDGALVTARLVTTPMDPVPADERNEAHPLLNSPSHVVAFLGTRRIDGSVWAVSEFVPGVSLERLLGIAILTPAQATYIAAAIFAGLDDLHRAGLAHRGLTGRHVLIGTDGRPRLAGWALAARGRSGDLAAAKTADLEAACALVDQLARNADRPVGRHSPGGAELLVRMTRLGTGGAPADAASAAQQLTDWLAAAEGVESGEVLLRTQVGALTTASAKAVPDDEPVDRPARQRFKSRPVKQPEPPVRPSASTLPRELSRADWSNPRRRRRAWLIAAVVVLVLAGGFVFARKPITSLTDRVLNRHPASSTTPTTSPSNANKAAARRAAELRASGQPRRMPVLAPAAAGAVTGVVLRPTASCRPGGVCPVRVAVHLRHASSTRHVAWRLALVNRCTGTRAIRAHGFLAVSPGSSSAFATRRVKLPPAHAVGLVAVTTAPAHAASRPLLVPARRASC